MREREEKKTQIFRTLVNHIDEVHEDLNKEEEETAENQEKPKKPVFEKAKFEKTLPYKCILCDNTNVLYFNEIDELKEHINAVHRTEPLNTNVHEEEGKRFKCSSCESRQGLLYRWKEHLADFFENTSTGRWK